MYQRKGSNKHGIGAPLREHAHAEPIWLAFPIFQGQIHFLGLSLLVPQDCSAAS